MSVRALDRYSKMKEKSEQERRTNRSLHGICVLTGEKLRNYTKYSKLTIYRRRKELRTTTTKKRYFGRISKEKCIPLKMRCTHNV